MTISKFLMTCAVCAVSISGISTSHGSNILSQDDHRTPTRSTEAHQSSVSSWSGVPRGNSLDDDVESVSARSARSTASMSKIEGAMDTLIEMLAKVPVSVTLPGDDEGKTPSDVNKSKAKFVKYALGNLIKAYTSLVVEYDRQTIQLKAAQDTITELRGQLQQTENNLVNTVETTPAEDANQTQLNNEDSPVETTPAVNNVPQWIGVTGGIVLGAGTVLLGNFIAEGFLSIAATIWGR